MASLEEEEDFKRCLSSVLLGLDQRGFKFILKEEQEKAIKHLYFGRDVVAVLPTGFGKSLIFQLLVLLKSEQFRRDGTVNCAATILVICPLRSLIEDQLTEVREFGISASSLPEANVEEVQKGKWQIIYSSPECALEQKFLSSLKEGEFHDNMAAVIIDESHTLQTWTGKRKTGTVEKAKVFRKAFGELATLRSFCKQGTPFLALTGTADKGTLDVIHKDLALKDADCFFVSPERKNLRFTVKKVKENAMFDQLTWLIDLVRRNAVNCPKTLIFCNTLNDIATVFNYLVLHLGPSAYHPPDSKKCILGIYHSNSYKEQKERLLQHLKGQGTKRIIVASSALSMGVNFPNVRYIINWGPARNLLDQLQEAGRAGRDGKPANVIIIFHGKQLSHCNTDVKDFVRAIGCYRVAAYSPFDRSVKPLTPKHDCCNYCSKTCMCQGQDCDVSFEFEQGSSDTTTYNETPHQTELIRTVNQQDKQDLKNALRELMSEMGRGQAAVFDKTATHGFSVQLIDDIVSNCFRIFTISDILSGFPVYSTSHAHMILEVINDIFMDIPDGHLENTTGGITDDPLSFDNTCYDWFANFPFSDSDAELEG